MERYVLFHKSSEVYYYISNYGNLKSFRIKTMKTILMKPSVAKTRPGDKQGYLQSRILIDGKYKNIRIHQLVAKHFVKTKGPKGYKEVNHKDGNKHNNHYKNLEWVTKSENTKHAINNGLFKVKTDHLKVFSTLRGVSDLDFNILSNAIKRIRKGEKVTDLSKETGIAKHRLYHYNKRSPLFGS